MNPLGQISAAESVVRSNPEGPRPESGACSEGNPVREKVLDLLTVLHVMYRSVKLPVIFAKWHLKFPGRDNFRPTRSEEHTSELQSLMRISYAVFCLKKKKKTIITLTIRNTY